MMKHFATLVIAALVVGCTGSGRKADSGQPTEMTGRGKIMDRNGVVLVEDCDSIPADSTGVISRRYPHPVAAHLLGYIGEGQKNEDFCDWEVIGKSGVERSYDSILIGRNGVAGKDLTLTIDSELQRFGEELMEGHTGAIVALEPSTGEVLCMVSSPTYDPRLLSCEGFDANIQALKEDTLKPLLNRCIAAIYPPGSVFEVAQGLVLMSEGIINPDTRYPCEKGFSHKGQTIECHGHASPLTLTAALSQACRGYFCHGFLDMLNSEKYDGVKDALGTWREYMTSLGFGYKLETDLPGEKRGSLPNAAFYDKAYSSWNGLTILPLAIGQGEVMASPLQMANLAAIVANRGHYYVPHVVKVIDGEAIDSMYISARQTKVSREACEAVAEGMRAAAVRGTCRALSELPFEACGITGRATLRGRDNSVFIGFAPASNPRIAVAVYVEDGGWGAKYGVPIGRQIMEKYLLPLLEL